MGKEIIKWKLDGEWMKNWEWVDFWIYLESMKGLVEVLDDIYAREWKWNLKIRIIEAKKWSLETIVWMFMDPSIVNGIFQSISSSKDLLDFFREYTGLMKFFWWKDPATIKIKNEIDVWDKITINGDNNSVTVQKTVYNYYTDKPEMRKKTANSFSALQSDTAVDVMKFETEDWTVPVSLERKDFQELSQYDFVHEEGDDIKIEKETVRISPIKTVYDSRDRKWEFITQTGRKISARIRDNSFWDMINDEKKSFRTWPRDTFEVQWQYVRKKDKISWLYVEMENSYEIIEIIRRIEKPSQTKI